MNTLCFIIIILWSVIINKMTPHHVGLGGELVRLQALQSHPLDRQLDSALVVDAVIFFIVHVSGQTEVCHLHRVALVQPERSRKSSWVKEVLVRCELRWINLGLTCSSWLPGLGAQTSYWPDTPSLEPPAARSPSDLSLLGSGRNTKQSANWIHLRFIHASKHPLVLTWASSRMKLRRSPCFM